MHVNHSSEISLAVTDAEMSTNCENTTNLDDLHEQEYKKIEASVSPVEEKRKAPRIKGWGLRRFSTIVCDKVKEKGRTTYNEVMMKTLLILFLQPSYFVCLSEKSSRDFLKKM